jgi:hypothetical protein
MNRDSFADVIVGAPLTGRAYVVFGKTDTDGVQLTDVAQGVGGFALDAEPEGHISGWSVSGAGDVNSDGIVDVLVAGSSVSPDGDDFTRTYVVFGKTDTSAVSLADVVLGIGGFALDSEAIESVFEASVSAAGDVNGDFIDDVVVGAPLVRSNDLENSGRTYVVFGGDFSCEGGQ